MQMVILPRSAIGEKDGSGKCNIQGQSRSFWMDKLRWRSRRFRYINSCLNPKIAGLPSKIWGKIEGGQNDFALFEAYDILIARGYCADLSYCNQYSIGIHTNLREISDRTQPVLEVKRMYS